jgi:hypothetical protein
MDRVRLTAGRLFAFLTGEPKEVYPYKPPRDLIYKFMRGDHCAERVSPLSSKVGIITP